MDFYDCVTLLLSAMYDRFYAVILLFGAHVEHLF